MSLLLPDYSSSSDDEDTSPVQVKPSHVSPRSSAASNAPTVTSGGVSEATRDALLSLAAATSSEPKKKTVKKTKKQKKTKTTLFLPPEIQRLLESGVAADSDDDEEGDSLLAKQKRAVAKRPRSNDAASTTSQTTSLSFLPAPKHQLEEPKREESVTDQSQPTAEEPAAVAAPETATTAPDAQAYDAYDAAAYQQYYQQYDAHYYQQQQQQHQHYDQQAYEIEQEPTSKRARHRDRELERMLQMGQFDSAADKIVEVQAPAPDAWQPPVQQLEKGKEGDVKVKASFWNSSAGTAVATVKPSRLQRQKHQLNQLAFDAKAREFDLLDRKGAAIKTKRETHAKYGW